MQKANLTANLVKVREVRVEGLTRFLIVTDNNQIGDLIIESSVLYNGARDSGISSATQLLNRVREMSEAGANPQEITRAFSEGAGFIIGEINSLCSGGEVNLSVVKYAEGDLIPITKKSYARYEENNFLDKNGNTVEIVEENGKYFIVASKDWESVSVTDIMFSKSMKILAVESMSRTQAIAELLRKPITNDVSIFGKKKDTPETPIINQDEIPEDDPFGEDEEAPAETTTTTTTTKGPKSKAK